MQRGVDVIAEIDPAYFGEGAEVSVAGETYTLTRDSILGGTFALRSGDRVVATARKPSAFIRTFEVDLSGRRFELKAVSVWRREFGLFEGGVQIGRTAPASWFGRAAVIDLPDEFPLPEQVFLFWLMLIMWRRSVNASAAAAAGS